jgi:hypothetical protein
MQTNYLIEIESLINNTFTPSISSDKKAVAKNLEEIHSMVINILPAKWIDETDVYTALQNLNFTPSYGKKDSEDGLFYFVLLK